VEKSKKEKQKEAERRKLRRFVLHIFSFGPEKSERTKSPPPRPLALQRQFGVRDTLLSENPLDPSHDVNIFRFWRERLSAEKMPFSALLSGL
jgi:hypothetical protein